MERLRSVEIVKHCNEHPNCPLGEAIKAYLEGAPSDKLPGQSDIIDVGPRPGDPAQGGGTYGPNGEIGLYCYMTVFKNGKGCGEAILTPASNEPKLGNK
jgi:hypothetical protein